VLKDKLTIHDAYHLATAIMEHASFFMTRGSSLAKKIKNYVEASTPEEIILEMEEDKKRKVTDRTERSTRTKKQIFLERRVACAV
jgi:hypothetical protein